MSSLRLLGRFGAEQPSSDGDDWIAVRSPLRQRGNANASAVIVSLASLRARYSDGGDRGSFVLDDAQADYGGGDSELADDIADASSVRWDD